MDHLQDATSAELAKQATIDASEFLESALKRTRDIPNFGVYVAAYVAALMSGHAAMAILDGEDPDVLRLWNQMLGVQLRETLETFMRAQGSPVVVNVAQPIFTISPAPK